MKYIPPKTIVLTNKEQELYLTVQELKTNEYWNETADAMELLFNSLKDRNIIPEKRILIFIDPNYAESRDKSPKEIFESNGSKGNEIIRHPHFIKWLKYFINGPELPQPFIDGLCNILKDDSGTSGEVLEHYCSFARSCVRNHKLNPKEAATEFFRLCIEIGMELDDSRTLRKAVMSVR